jgi:hypothetical protein
VKTIKIDTKLSARASAGLGPHADALYEHLGGRAVAVVELAAMERNEVADEEDKEPYVKLRLTAIEVAGGEQEQIIRGVLRSLYTIRTAEGTLTDEQQVELSKETLRLAADSAVNIEAARLRVALLEWARYARQASTTTRMTAIEALHELEIIAKGLQEALTAPVISA